MLVAGDLVEGRWNVDTTARELFGPVSQGIDRRAWPGARPRSGWPAERHYSFYSELFGSRGLKLFPAVGDHEILDDREGPMADRWSPSGGTRQRPDNRYHLVDHCPRTSGPGTSPGPGA